MKKFTFLLALFMITILASTQNKNDLQYKLQRTHEKISKITQRTARLSKLSERQTLNPESLLKSLTATQKLDSTVDRVLDAVTQTWRNDLKDEFNYNSELKNTSWLSKEWNLTTKTWGVISKTELGYDNKNRVNSMLTYEIDSITHVLTKDSKIFVFYNSEGLQDSTIWYSTKTAGISWVLEMKEVYHYNASKQLIKMDMWALDEQSGVFALSMNVVYNYTVAGKIKTSSTNYFMDGEEMLWSKMEYNYDGSGKLTSSEISTLNFSTFVLEKSSRSTYQYNASNDVSVEIYSTWSGTLWVDQGKDENTYSTTNFSDVIYPSFIYLYGGNEPGWSMNKQITGVNSYEMKSGTWLNSGKTFFYYSSGTSTNITEFGNALFTVYPNPASERVNFNWKGNYESLSLELYQITGAKVMEQITYSGKPVSISKLANGVYFFKLLNGKQMVHTGKIIKR